MRVCSNGVQFTRGSKCVCAVMGYSLHKGQYVHVCSNGVQFTRGSMCVCAVMGYSLQGAVCACVQ